MSSENYFEGIVDKFIGGDGRNFGFISYRTSGQECRVFFTGSSVRSDSIGRRGHITFAGALVRFRIEQRIHKGQQGPIAVDVHPVFEDEKPKTSVEDHREVSRVARISSGRQSAWLERVDGSQIFFHKNSVLPEYLDRFVELRVNDFVYHGVECNELGSWAAANAELFSCEENQKLQRGESLNGPESAVETEERFEPELETVLAPATRHKSLLEIILEKRGGSNARTI